MAFVDFFMETTGNNLNSGSTTGAASVTSTNGSWDITANRFIAAGGATPFLSVTVGMYASIYLNAATSAVFVSKITAVDPAGTYLEVSKTANKLGTAPTAGATGRSCAIGGAWAGLTIASLFGAVTIDQATRINIKAGAYTDAAARTFSTNGTAALPLWFRGYNATPGDLDDYSALAKPVFTFTSTGRLLLSGTFITWSNCEFTAAVANTTVNIAGANSTLHRCKITNTTANAGSTAVTMSGAAQNWTLSCCWFNTTSSAPNVLTSTLIGGVFGCVFTGGSAGLSTAFVSGSVTIVGCLFLSIGGEGIEMTGITAGIGLVHGCTFYGLSSHAIDITVSAITTGCVRITNCNFWAITGYGITASATTTQVFRAGNDFRSCSSGDESGMGDMPGAAGAAGATWGSQDETADPWTSTTNMTPLSTSKAYEMALPRTFEYQSYSTYGDVGAVQHLGSKAMGYPLVVRGADYIA